MSIFSKLTPEQAEQVKNCKSKEEQMKLLRSFTELSADEMNVVSGGVNWVDLISYNKMDYSKCDVHGYWTGNADCYLSCPYAATCDNLVWSPGDPCEDVKPENVSSDFAAGRITGADFFA